VFTGKERVMRFVWAVVVLLTLLIGAAWVLGLLMAQGAPQEAAVSASSAAAVVMLYVLARAIEGVFRRGP
jgi:predicted RND superfamily exporter protein